MLNKKLSPNYIGKLSLLLYDSNNYKDYVLKRKNLNNTIFKDMGENKMRLTFKKLPIKIVKRNNNENKLTRNLTQMSPNFQYLSRNLEEIKEKNNSTSNINFDNNFHTAFMINDEVKEILYNNEEKISLKKQKTVYEKVKNKIFYYRPKFMFQMDSPFFNTKIKIIPKKINLKSISLSNSLLKKFQTESQASNSTDINNLLETCNSLKTLRDKKKINSDLLNNKQQLYEKIKEELLTSNKKKKERKRALLSKLDLFNYNSKKWNELNEQNNAKKEKEELDKMILSVNKVFNESIRNFKNKSNYYNDKLVKLTDIINKRRISSEEINKDFYIE